MLVLEALNLNIKYWKPKLIAVNALQDIVLSILNVDNIGNILNTRSDR